MVIGSPLLRLKVSGIGVILAYQVQSDRTLSQTRCCQLTLGEVLTLLWIFCSSNKLSLTLYYVLNKSLATRLISIMSKPIVFVFVWLS